jgi:hypothetical protein
MVGGPGVPLPPADGQEGVLGTPPPPPVVLGKPDGRRHKGFGKYEVLDAAGNVLAEGLSRDAADAMIAEAAES